MLRMRGMMRTRLLKRVPIRRRATKLMKRRKRKRKRKRKKKMMTMMKMLFRYVFP